VLPQILQERQKLN